MLVFVEAKNFSLSINTNLKKLIFNCDVINPVITLILQWRLIVLNIMLVNPVIFEELTQTDRTAFGSIDNNSRNCRITVFAGV